MRARHHRNNGSELTLIPQSRATQEANVPVAYAGSGDITGGDGGDDGGLTGCSGGSEKQPAPRSSLSLPSAHAHLRLQVEAEDAHTVALSGIHHRLYSNEHSLYLMGRTG